MRFDDASVHGKAFALYQACVHAATQHFIEQPAKQITAPKTAVSFFGEGRVVGDFIFKAQPAEPAIRQVQMGLFAQPPFGADAIAVADDQHADHQFRINGGRPIGL